MKKLITSVFLLILITSCSNEALDSDLDSNLPVLKNYIYNTYQLDGNVLNSTTYEIIDNKIVNATGTNLQTSSETDIEYTYTNNLISEIKTFLNGNLTRLQTYSYDSNANLIEYNNQNNTSSGISRMTYMHTPDTIYGTSSYSQDGINFDIGVDYKFALDNNFNTTYLETYYHSDGDIKFDINTYDSNSNVISEGKYAIMNGLTVTLLENYYNYDSVENPFNKVWETMFNRKNLMLLYPLMSNALNDANAKSISKNNMTEYETTFGTSSSGNFATFEINSQYNDDNSITNIDYKTIVEGNLFNRFSIDYIYE